MTRQRIAITVATIAFAILATVPASALAMSKSGKASVKQGGLPALRAAVEVQEAEANEIVSAIEGLVEASKTNRSPQASALRGLSWHGSQSLRCPACPLHARPVPMGPTWRLPITPARHTRVPTAIRSL